ncbi:hypothetical protein [Paludibacter propionicigenes]|nr:hypothetical protein [Paludibacter propionicigenes]
MVYSLLLISGVVRVFFRSASFRSGRISTITSSGTIEPLSFYLPAYTT